MTFILVIVESPAKCQKIEKYLGPGYKVIGSFGHITHLSSLVQVDFSNNFFPNFHIIESKKQQIDKIKRLIKQSSDVILATDDDREGEAIAWHICQQFNLDVYTTKRIIFHEITETAINNAIINPGVLNLDLVNAQQGRQILDLIVGFKITPLLWKHIMSNTKNSLSAGRCQTPALRLVYDNYKDIENSPGKIQFTSNGIFFDKQITFQLNYNHETIQEIEEFLEKSKDFNYVFTRDNDREVMKNPPQPFTTSTLQQSANNNINISPKETMSLAQRLYEAGYITYMRTDSKVYSKEFVDKACRYISQTYNQDGLIHSSLSAITQNAVREKTDKTKDGKTGSGKRESSKSKKPKKDNNAQEAHEAIRPTSIEVIELPKDEDVFTPRHRKLYKLIWNNTLESIMSPAKISQFTSKITAPNSLFYKFTSEIIIFPGWKIVQGFENDKYYNYLKAISSDNINVKRISSKQSLRELKSHYSEAKLVQLLEQKGIGRPSTFSSLVEKIQDRQYVKRQDVKGRSISCYEYILENQVIVKQENVKEFGNEKNKLVITQTGVLVIEFLLTHFDSLFDYQYTKSMEDKLDIIAKGNMTYSELCRECVDFIEKLNRENNLDCKNTKEQLDKSTRINIKIDDNHTYLIGKNGPTIKRRGENGDMFFSVKPDISIDKLKLGEYKITDIIDENYRDIGIWNSHNIYLKNGKFGPYLEWNNVKKALKSVKINVPHDKISLEDAISIFENTTPNENQLIRKINDCLSIRKGRYGDYIFYKTDTMKKPQFLRLTSFDGNYINCNEKELLAWILEKYKIQVNTKIKN
tara:strand:+ start:947 stop:3373 length:2427 start_codon:yes stop_codon:yes gene_type:complete